MIKKGIPLQNLFYLFSSGTLLFTFLSLIPANNYFIELISHFKLQYFLGSIIFAFVSLLYKRFYLMTMLVFALLTNSFHIIPWYIPPSSEANIERAVSKQSIKIYHANILSRNRSYLVFFEQINEEKPDILLLQEINADWKGKLEELGNVYPYRKIIARPDNFGIAILSKFPINNLAVRDWGHVGLPSFLARINVGEGDFSLAYTHPLPPVNQQYFRLRNIQLSDMVKELQTLNEPLVIAGDFNLSMWSPAYHIFSPLKLTNTRHGHGMLSSWPSIFYRLGLPIDHILVSDAFENSDTYTRDLKGSDHRPIISVLSFSSLKEI